MEFIDNYIWIEFSFTSCYWTKDRLATRNSTSSSAIIKFKKSKMERSYCQIQSVPPRRRIFRYVVSTFNLSSSASRNFTSKSVPSDIWKLSISVCSLIISMCFYNYRQITSYLVQEPQKHSGNQSTILVQACLLRKISLKKFFSYF